MAEIRYEASFLQKNSGFREDRSRLSHLRVRQRSARCDASSGRAFICSADEDFFFKRFRTMELPATARVQRGLVLGVISAACWLFAGPALAAIQTQPSSLNPGDQYRLVFVTSTGTNPNSANIGDYNAFVTSHANAVPGLAALGAQWTAIASTTSVNARQNTGTDPTPAGPTGVPIFLLNDTLFASNYDDLWDGSPTGVNLNITELGAPLGQINQTLNNGWVWTGSDDSGIGFAGRELGSFSTTKVFGDSSREGGSDAPSGTDGWIRDDVAHQSHIFSVYGMSSILTVPGDSNVVPEAASLAIWAGLSLAAGCVLIRSRRAV